MEWAMRRATSRVGRRPEGLQLSNLLLIKELIVCTCGKREARGGDVSSCTIFTGDGTVPTEVSAEWKE